MSASPSWFILLSAVRFFGNLGVYRFRRGIKRSRGRVSSFPLVTLEKITANDNFALAA